MLHKVVGIKRSQGNYEGYDYDNVNVHCVCESDGKMLAGVPVEVVKIKAQVFDGILSRYQMGLDDLIDHQIRVFYDKFGKANDFDVVDVK